MERLKDQALTHLDLAEALCRDGVSQVSSVAHEIEPTRKMLRETVFYASVSSDELKAVVAAMTNELTGSGHWYRCTNGHLFTIGECGGPTMTSRCPECGATVGGHDHEAAEGVSSAPDIEQDFGGMRI